MSVFAVVLLAAAVLLLVAAEWPRMGSKVGIGAWESRDRARRKLGRARRKTNLHVVPPDFDESDDFARSVERDLAALPTIDEQDAKR